MANVAFFSVLRADEMADFKVHSLIAVVVTVVAVVDAHNVVVVVVVVVVVLNVVDILIAVVDVLTVVVVADAAVALTVVVVAADDDVVVVVAVVVVVVYVVLANVAFFSVLHADEMADYKVHSLIAVVDDFDAVVDDDAHNVVVGSLSIAVVVDIINVTSWPTLLSSRSFVLMRWLISRFILSMLLLLLLSMLLF